MRNTLIAITLTLLASTVADARPRRHRPRDIAWMTTCIHERTGPTGGISKAEARTICLAELPEDEVDAAKQQLALAKANAKIAKAVARVNKAIEACESAVVAACVEGAKPDGSTDCEDEFLVEAFAQCFPKQAPPSK